MYSHFVHLDLVVAISGHLQVGVVTGRAELVACHHEEDEGGQLLEQLVQPLVLKRHCDLIVEKGRGSYICTRFIVVKVENFTLDYETR